MRTISRNAIHNAVVSGNATSRPRKNVGETLEPARGELASFRTMLVGLWVGVVFNTKLDALQRPYRAVPLFRRPPIE